jgi:hypothetical protein
MARLPMSSISGSGTSRYTWCAFYNDLPTPQPQSVIPSLTSKAPMSSSNNPARGNNDANAPPPPPPQYADVPNIELRDDEAAGSSQPNIHRQPNFPPPPPPRSNTKNEASSYVGSYRPSDAQTPIPSVAHAAQASRTNIPPA